MIRTLAALLLAGLLVATNADSSGTCSCSECGSLDCDTATTNCNTFGGVVATCTDDSQVTCTGIACEGDDDANCDTACAGMGCSSTLWTCTQSDEVDYDHYYSYYYHDDGKKKKDDDDDNSCFHEDTVITYKDGTSFTLSQLMSNAGGHADCSVPHVVTSTGVRIETSCRRTLRVTDTHLVATDRGFQLAYSLQPGNILFGDFDGNERCVVESVNKERSVQKYFGLNCLHSEVLADGIRTSTFGDFHTLPSWYMYYVGNMVGAEKASSLGNYIAEWYYGLKN